MFNWDSSPVSLAQDWLVATGEGVLAPDAAQLSDTYELKVGDRPFARSLRTLFEFRGEPYPPELAALPGVAVDDADEAPERALLHLHNCCRETGAGLLLVAREPPSRWKIALPDLASRLRAMPVAAILPPDDALLAGLLIKHFADRQLRVPPALINYAVHRIERSFAAAAGFVDALDRAALGAGRPIGLALVRRVLAEIGDQREPRSDLGVT